jgi:anti-sigma B factor antagonist
LTDYRSTASDLPETAGAPRRRVSPFAVAVTATDADTVVTVAGEIDLTVSESLRRSMEEELRLGPAALIADLTEVSFCDSSGFTALVQVRAQAEEAGILFILVTRERALLRPLALLGLDSVFNVHPTLDSARDALTR